MVWRKSSYILKQIHEPTLFVLKRRKVNLNQKLTSSGQTLNLINIATMLSVTIFEGQTLTAFREMFALFSVLFLYRENGHFRYSCWETFGIKNFLFQMINFKLIRCNIACLFILDNHTLLSKMLLSWGKRFEIFPIKNVGVVYVLRYYFSKYVRHAYRNITV